MPLSKFNYSNADCDKLNQALSEINWNTAIGEECTNKVHNFLTKVEQACRNTLIMNNFNKIYSKGKKNTHEKKNSNNAEIETLNHPSKYKTKTPPEYTPSCGNQDTGHSNHIL